MTINETDKSEDPCNVVSIQESSADRKPSLPNKNFSKKVLHIFVTAHPDDESMFFLPTMNALLKAGEIVWLICLTSGNYDGLGETRKMELSRVCALLGIHKLICLDNKDLNDHPTKSWSLDAVTSHIENALLHALRGNEDVFQRLALITFDMHGVSGHINHRDTFFGVRNFVLHRQSKFPRIDTPTAKLAEKGLPPVEAWQLDSVQSLAAKYLPAKEWFLILLYLCFLWRPEYTSLPELSSAVKDGPEMANRVHIYRSVNPLLSWKAMATHESQFVWYRRLFVVFSCYTFINTLRPIR